MNSVNKMSLMPRLETLNFDSGERLPLLIDRDSGVPLFDPTVFVLQTARARGLAANTIEHVLRSVALLLRFLTSHQIDLESRLREGRLLTLNEVEALGRACQLTSEVMAAEEWGAGGGLNEIVRVAGTNKHTRVARAIVENRTVVIRLTYAAQYLKWLSTRYLQGLSFDQTLLSATWTAVEQTVSGIRERRPLGNRTDTTVTREGLDPLIARRMWTVVRPDGHENPWLSKHVRVRNYLILRWFEGIGLRPR